MSGGLSWGAHGPDDFGCVGRSARSTILRTQSKHHGASDTSDQFRLLGGPTSRFAPLGFHFCQFDGFEVFILQLKLKNENSKTHFWRFERLFNNMELIC